MSAVSANIITHIPATHTRTHTLNTLRKKDTLKCMELSEWKDIDYCDRLKLDNEVT